MTDDDGGASASAHEVHPGLLVGEFEAALAPALEARRVTHVVCCLGDTTPAADALGEARVLHLPLADRPAERIDGAVLAATRFIAAALDSGGRVLVHCHQGVSRSVAVAAGFLVVRHGATADGAVAAIQARRPVACPNSGFVAQLRAIEVGVAACLAAPPPSPPPTREAARLVEMAALRLG